MDKNPSTAQSQEENSEPQIVHQAGCHIDPSWEKWRNEQVQTISSILSTVFRVEDEARHRQAPSRLLRNPAKQSGGSEEEICEKLNAIRQQISEYEQVLQMSLKRIDSALKEIHPPEPEACPKPAPQQIPHFHGFKNWLKKILSFKTKNS